MLLSSLLVWEGQNLEYVDLFWSIHFLGPLNPFKWFLEVSLSACMSLIKLSEQRVEPGHTKLIIDTLGQMRH